MGFSNATPIYLAAGKIYEAEKTMAPLRQMFPFLHTKETLLSPEELEPLNVSNPANTSSLVKFRAAYGLKFRISIINQTVEAFR